MVKNEHNRETHFFTYFHSKLASQYWDRGIKGEQKIARCFRGVHVGLLGLIVPFILSKAGESGI